MTDTPDTADTAADDFAHLAQEANALEGGAPLPGSPEAAASEAQNLKVQIDGNAELIEFGFQCLAPMLPGRYVVRYGPGERARIAEAYTKLAIKRGWDMGELFEKWGAEIALVVAIAGPALPVFLADVKRKKEGEGADVSDSQATH